MSTPAESVSPHEARRVPQTDPILAVPPLPANDGFILPLPSARRPVQPPTAEMRARGVEIADELLRHIAEPWPEGEPSWTVADLLAEDRDA